MTDPRLVDVLAHIEAGQEGFRARLIDYLRHPSISAQDIGIREVALLLETMLRELGMTVSVIETEGHPMVVGQLGADPQKPTILFYGHYDVQPPEPLELWTSPPFEPEIRDGRIWARGAGDNKGQHFAQILAIESWLAVAGELPCNVKILLEGEEEIGSPHIAPFVAAHRELLAADLVVNADGPLAPSGAPVITFGTRGAVRFELHARACNRDLHSGNFGGAAPNAIWDLVQLLATMKDGDGNITIPGVLDDLLPPGPRERAAADALPVDLPSWLGDLGITAMEGPAGRPLHDRIMFWPTLTVNGIQGGYTGPGTKTVIPAAAMAKCDMRLSYGQDPARVMAAVKAHVARHAPNVEVLDPGDGKFPSWTPMDNEWAPALIAGVEAGQECKPQLWPMLGASGPDSVFTGILGVPSFYVPYANADERNHAPDENITLECFRKGIRTGAAIIAHIAAQGVKSSATAP